MSNVLALQPEDVASMVSGVAVTFGVTTGGGIAGPNRLCNVAVVTWPVASTIVIVAGLTQIPVVIAENAPPNGMLTPLSIVTALGTEVLAEYGGVPPKTR